MSQHVQNLRSSSQTAGKSAVHRCSVTVALSGFASEEKLALERFSEFLLRRDTAGEHITVCTAGKRIGLPVMKKRTHKPLLNDSFRKGKDARYSAYRLRFELMLLQAALGLG